jgi:hypothetical protein
VASNMLLGETLSGLGMVGAGCITLAAATNVFLDLGPSKDVEEEVRTESEWIELNRTDVNATLPFLDV